MKKPMKICLILLTFFLYNILQAQQTTTMYFYFSAAVFPIPDERKQTGSIGPKSNLRIRTKVFECTFNDNPNNDNLRTFRNNLYNEAKSEFDKAALEFIRNNYPSWASDPLFKITNHGASSLYSYDEIQARRVSDNYIEINYNFNNCPTSGKSEGSNLSTNQSTEILQDKTSSSTTISNYSTSNEALLVKASADLLVATLEYALTDRKSSSNETLQVGQNGVYSPYYHSGKAIWKGSGNFYGWNGKVFVSEDEEGQRIIAIENYNSQGKLEGKQFYSPRHGNVGSYHISGYENGKEIENFFFHNDSNGSYIREDSFENKQLSAYVYKSKREGVYVFRTYYENGSLKYDHQYKLKKGFDNKELKQLSEYVVYHENGNVLYKFKTDKKGLPVTDIDIFDQDGNTLRTIRITESLKNRALSNPEIFLMDLPKLDQKKMEKFSADLADELLTQLIKDPFAISKSEWYSEADAYKKWQIGKYPNIKNWVKGYNFFSSFQDYEYGGYMTLVYNISTNDSQISKNLNMNDAAYLALEKVLELYRNILQLKPQAKRDPLLDSYKSLTDKEKMKKIKKESNMKLDW